MPIKKLLSTLQAHYPDLTFTPGKLFKWSAKEKTIYYNQADPEASSLLLHELAHACLKHDDFSFDVELVRKEDQAWQYAMKELAPKYRIKITPQEIKNAIDSYREWLHSRSLCPDCGINGLQIKSDTYTCAACKCQWRVNDARICELRRYRLVKF